MLSMSSMSHVSVKHIKLLRWKPPSNRTSAVNSSILFWRARTFDRVIVGRGCLLPRFFSRSLTPPLDPHFLFFFSFPISFNNVTKVHFQIGARCVALEGEQKLTCLPMSVFTLRENLRHKVTQKVASTPPQTEYTSLLSSYTCMHTFANVQRPQETQQHNDETAIWRATGQPQSCGPFSIESCSARSDHMPQILDALHWLNFLSNSAFSIKLRFLPLNKWTIN